MGVCLLAAGCVETRILEDVSGSSSVSPSSTPAPAPAASALPLQGGDRASPPGGQRTNQPLAQALLDYLDNNDPAALAPLDRHARRGGDLQDHEHHLAGVLVAASQVLRGKKPRYLTREQKIVTTFLVPSAGERRWLRDMLMTLLNRQLASRSDTAFRQIKDGHFTLSFGLSQMLKKIDLVKVKPGAVVADIGCGVGSQTVELARMVGPRGKVHAVDIDAGVVAFLRHLKKHVAGGRRILPKKSVIENVGLEAQSLDLALIHGINFLFKSDGEEIPHHAFSLIWSIQRALKPGGHLLVRTYLDSARQSAFISRCGLEQVGRHASRENPIKGPQGKLLEDTWLLFRRDK